MVGYEIRSETEGKEYGGKSWDRKGRVRLLEGFLLSLNEVGSYCGEGS